MHMMMIKNGEQQLRGLHVHRYVCISNEFLGARWTCYGSVVRSNIWQRVLSTWWSDVPLYYLGSCCIN